MKVKIQISNTGSATGTEIQGLCNSTTCYRMNVIKYAMNVLYLLVLVRVETFQSAVKKRLK
jgi:hypothetical protein